MLEDSTINGSLYYTNTTVLQEIQLLILSGRVWKRMCAVTGRSC